MGLGKKRGDGIFEVGGGGGGAVDTLMHTMSDLITITKAMVF